jgi:hypothetical protein
MTVSPYEIRKTLEKRLYDVVSPLGIRMSERNRKFEPKKNQDKLWVRPTIRFGNPTTLEKGEEALGERPGVFIIQVFLGQNLGIAEAENLCAAIENAFRLKTLDGVHCGEPSTVEVGMEPGMTLGDDWYQFNVTVPFWAWVGK